MFQRKVILSGELARYLKYLHALPRKVHNIVTHPSFFLATSYSFIRFIWRCFACWLVMVSSPLSYDVSASALAIWSLINTQFRHNRQGKLKLKRNLKLVDKPKVELKLKNSNSSKTSISDYLFSESIDTLSIVSRKSIPDGWYQTTVAFETCPKRVRHLRVFFGKEAESVVPLLRTTLKLNLQHPLPIDTSKP